MSIAGGMSRTIKLRPGTYFESVVIVNQDLVLHGAGSGAGGSVIDPPDNTDGVAIAAGATVTVEDLKISGASGVAPPNAIRCTDSTITLRRTVIDANPGGGVGITACNFSLVNNIVSRNGGPTSFFGGVSLAMLGGGAGTSYAFAFNTVAANSAPIGNVAGVNCSQINVTIPLTSSIVYGNDVLNAREIGTDSDCVATDSVVGDPGQVPPNQDVDPRFASTSDFHLMPASPVEGDAVAPTTLDHDVDGHARPLGTGCEPGADELVP